MGVTESSTDSLPVSGSFFREPRKWDEDGAETLEQSGEARFKFRWKDVAASVREQRNALCVLAHAQTYGYSMACDHGDSPVSIQLPQVPFILSIHPTAFIDPAAELGSDVSVGPFAVIEANVRIGNGCKIHGHAQVLSGVTLGEECEVGHASIIGGAPQDLGFDQAIPSGVQVGTKTIFREHVTIHRSSVEGGKTIIGERNFFMGGTHAGHDCVVGDGNVLANHALLAGHVQLGSHCFLGGGAGFHQFIRIGDRCMVKGLGRMSQDIPPYVIAGECNEVFGLNSIGLRRAGFSAETRLNLKAAFKLILSDGLLLKEALAAAETMQWEAPAETFLDFFRGESKKGICSR